MSNPIIANQPPMARDKLDPRQAERPYAEDRDFAGRQERGPCQLSARASRTLARIQRAADECCVGRY